MLGFKRKRTNLHEKYDYPYQTLFSDETDGPLDPERKRMFVAMKREVIRLGGYEQELFVSQTPELWLLADSVIEVKRFSACRERRTA